MMKFVDISEILDKLIVDLRYYGDYNFVGTKIDGYEERIAILSHEAAMALNKANIELNQMGYGIIIYDTYRPQRAVNHFIRWADDIDDIKMKDIFYPDLDKKDLFKLGYIASKSSHSRGSTVDLSLYSLENKEPLDMGGNFDYFSDISHSDFIDGLSEKQINNRKLLKDVMMKNGFDYYESEWWHFTLKDEPYPNTYFDFPICKKSLNTK